MRVDKGATITLPMAGPSTEYDLKGWKSASGKEYPVGYRFQVKEPTTFSAVWVPSTFTMRFTFYFYYAALLHRKKRMEISVRNCYSNGVAYNSVKRTTNPMKDCDAYEMTMVCANSSSTVEITVAIEGSYKKSKITVAPSTSTSINVWINRSGNLDLNESY